MYAVRELRARRRRGGGWQRPAAHLPRVVRDLHAVPADGGVGHGGAASREQPRAVAHEQLHMRVEEGGGAWGEGCVGGGGAGGAGPGHRTARHLALQRRARKRRKSHWGAMKPGKPWRRFSSPNAGSLTVHQASPPSSHVVCARMCVCVCGGGGVMEKGEFAHPRARLQCTSSTCVKYCTDGGTVAVYTPGVDDGVHASPDRSTPPLQCGAVGSRVCAGKRRGKFTR
jgi:hypothetical protein